MVQPHGLHDGVVKRDAVFLDIVKIAVRRHFRHVHREIRVRHLLFDGALQAAAAAGGVKEEVIVPALVQRPEEGDALDVVPVKMRDEDVRVDGLAAEFGAQRLAQIAEAGAAIEHVDAAVDPHLDAGGVAPVTHVLGLRRRGRAPHTPELDVHAPPAAPSPRPAGLRAHATGLRPRSFAPQTGSNAHKWRKYMPDFRARASTDPRAPRALFRSS